MDVIEDCGRKHVSSVVLLSAGFKEVGPEGAELERVMVARCRELGIMVLGPNCLGFVNYKDKIAAYGLLMAGPLEAGSIGLISQSGVMVLQCHRHALTRGIGLAASLSVGNAAMLTHGELISGFVAREDVRVIGALIEGFGDTAAFLAAADSAVEASKPLVVLKVGRSEVSQRSAIAHTGSLAGADAVVDAVFRQKGVIRVNSPEELIETCGMLAAAGWPRGRRIACVTTSGGACGLLSDLAAGTRVEIPDFAPQTKARLAELLPAFGTPQNPLDTTGVIVNQPGLLAGCIDAVLAEGAFDGLLINSDPPRDPGASPGRVEERFIPLADVIRRSPIFTTVSATTSSELTPFGKETLARHGLHFANGLQLGIRALDSAIFYGEFRNGLPARRQPSTFAPSGHRGEAQGAIAGVTSEVDVLRLLGGRGISSPAFKLVQTADEAAAAAALIGFPVVVKVQSPDIPHKTDAGGVRLGVRNEADAKEAFGAVTTCVPGAKVLGALVVKQVSPVAELIAGIATDPQFGHVVLVGLGGIYAEVLKDVSMRLPPIDMQTAAQMLGELRGSAVLKGARGRPPADLDAVARALVALGDIAIDFGDRLVELDVNPLFAMREGVLAGDALMVLK
jgi:acetate---CoA ligase (ADP-forming)